MCLEAKVAEKYYTNYNSDREWLHPGNLQYVNLVKIWGNCNEGHIMCSCPYWDKHDEVVGPDNRNAAHRGQAITVIDRSLEEGVINEALTSNSSLIRERARVLYEQDT